jgi:hypothetical protein
MRILQPVWVVSLIAGAALGCEETNRPPGAPPCESATVDASPSDGAPRTTIPCPIPATGGTPGGYSTPPPVTPGAAAGNSNIGSASTEGGTGETGTGGATGFGGFLGAAGLSEPGRHCCG